MEQTLDTRYGQIGFARLVLLALGAPILWFVLGRDGEEPRHLPRPWIGAVALFGVLVAATPGLAGHASAGELVEVAVVTDTFHVLAMAGWLGGLATLASVVLRKRWSASDIEAPLIRWSHFALGCVAVIVATGAFQTWRQVGNLTALRTTEFGRILVVKIVLVAALLMLAVFSRESVRSLWPRATTKTGRRVPVVSGGADDHAEISRSATEQAEHEASELTRLRRSVWSEVLVAVLVLAVTALLVNAPPAKSAAENAQGNAVGITLKASDVWVDVVVVPGERGQNAVHVSALTPGGKVKDVEDLTVTFDLPGAGIEGLEVPLERISPGHYTASGFALPVEGTWRVTAKAVVSEFTQRTIRSEIEIDDE
jgi:copper transport protein